MEKKDFTYLYSDEEKERFAWCRQMADKLSYCPLISIVVPVYHTPVRLLDEMIASVAAQSYGNWELCIANASPEDEALSAALAAWQEKDARIHVKDLAENGGISANTNECFAMVQGEYTAMLDHDDLLTENALFEVVWCLQEHPELDFIYSDQDMIDEDSTRRFNPLYKPRWSRDMMYSGNYITHFSVLRTSLIQKAGGWDPKTDGAQDWDLFLKAAELTDRIHGIPRILYHWRMASTSTASSMETKSYALDAQLRAVKAHLDRMGEKQADVVFYNRDIFKMQIRWNRIHDRDISVILVKEHEDSDLNLLIAMIRMALDLKEKEIILVTPRQRFICCEGTVKMVCHAFRSRAEAYAAGAREASGELLLFLTDGVHPLQKDTLKELADWAMYDRVAVAAPVFTGEDRIIREMGIALTKDGPLPMFAGEFADGTSSVGKNYWYRNVQAADDSCFAIQRDRYLEVGGFLEEEGELSMLKLCQRLRQKGYRHVVSPYAKMTLHQSASAHTLCQRIRNSSMKEYMEFMENRGLPGEDPCYRR